MVTQFPTLHATFASWLSKWSLWLPFYSTTECEGLHCSGYLKWQQYNRRLFPHRPMITQAIILAIGIGVRPSTDASHWSVLNLLSFPFISTELFLSKFNVQFFTTGSDFWSDDKDVARELVVREYVVHGYICIWSHLKRSMFKYLREEQHRKRHQAKALCDVAITFSCPCASNTPSIHSSLLLLALWAYEYPPCTDLCHPLFWKLRFFLLTVRGESTSPVETPQLLTKLWYEHRGLAQKSVRVHPKMPQTGLLRLVVSAE